MDKLCPGKHQHEVTGSATKIKQPDGSYKTIDRTVFAGWYTDKFCNSLLDGLEADLFTPPEKRMRFKASVETHETYPAAGSKHIPCPVPGCFKYFSQGGGLDYHLEHGHTPDELPPSHRKRRKLGYPEPGTAERAEKENNQDVDVNKTPSETISGGGDSSPIPNDSSPSPMGDPTVLGPSSTVLELPNYAPLMDFRDKTQCTDQAAQAHGFSSAEVWRQRTMLAKELQTKTLPPPPVHESGSAAKIRPALSRRPRQSPVAWWPAFRQSAPAKA